MGVIKKCYTCSKLMCEDCYTEHQGVCLRGDKKRKDKQPMEIVLQKEKYDMLLVWLKSVILEGETWISEEDCNFQLHYWWLFRSYPKFYSWGKFIRDHGMVGLRE